MIFRELYRRSVRFLYERYVAPLSGAEDDRRREFILNIILLASIAMIAIMDAFVLYFSVTLGARHKGISFTLFSVILACFLVLYILSRRGWRKASSYCLIALYFASISSGAYYWGVDLPMILLSYALLIIVASILLGTKFSYVVAFVICAYILPLWDLQIQGIVLAHWYWKSDLDFVHGVEFAILLLIITIVSWLSNREIERSLLRARSSEEDLRVERNLLEVKVEERTLELKQAQLERISQLSKFAEMGRLATGMVHDLLNPLTAVALNIEELDRKEPGSIGMKDSLESAIEATHRMENLINAIRKRMSQKESQSTFSLNFEIDQVLQLFDYQAKKHGVRLYFVCRNDIKIFGDQVKFHQIVANLISNAVDAYDSNLSQASSKKEVLVTLSGYRGIVCLSVQDWGSGIPPENLEKVFDPFFTTKDVNKGSGLGLSTVKELVERSFSGKLEIHSVPQEGTTVTLEFAE